MRRAFVALGAAALLLGAACGDDDSADMTPSVAATQGAGPGSFDLVMADVARAEPDPAEAAAAAQAGAQLGFDILAALEDDGGNLAISPYSIQVALAMARAGARGETLEEMNAVLHVSPAADYDAGMNALDQLLLSRAGEFEIGDDQTVTLELATANSLWGQRGFEFEQEFLDRLARDFGAGMRLVDYVAATEDARRAINGWVSDQTRERIPELIPDGVLDDLTRLVLTNAVYLNAPWLFPFDPDATEDGAFTRLDGSTVAVPMMHHDRNFQYAAGPGYAAIELPYAGQGLAMLIIVPDEGEFESVLSGLDAAEVAATAGSLTTHQVTLAMPRFEFRTQSPLKDVLIGLGMEAAFDPTRADFSGITLDATDFHITDVLHEAFISVDEEGTEAAAATAVIAGVTSLPPPAELRIDRPFFFAIRDTESGALLFIGRVTDPTAS